ncbi:ThiF family adenylyltransferase [Streptomyces roseicoloratus]|uniref:ThiF family adenylyltransferase n=1 Tax=Streptomyces roseicoloratus TaxID=2508722 RepID=UPI001009DD36|nr:ThiF family adenylyltransferase [Streptomyces roseicoloratus]
MHPMVKPALRRAWRNMRYVQFGVTPAHAVVLGPVDTTTGSLIGLLDGTRGMKLLRAEAAALGLPEGRLDALLDRLAAAGLIADASVRPPGGRRDDDPGGRADPALDPVRADLASLSVVHRAPDGAARALAARRASRVQVRGAGRVGAAVAALLSAAGVGRVEVLDAGTVAPWEVSPSGLPPESVGDRRAVAARRLVTRAAPGGRPPRRARTAGGRPGVRAGERPGGRAGGQSGKRVAGWDGGSAGGGNGGRGEGGGGGGGGETGVSLVVVAPRDGLGAYVPDPVPAEPWIVTGTPHLYAGVLEATGVVGPLVLPGGTACAGCMQRELADREPVWPRLPAQWRSGRPHPLPACDVSLASAVAGLAAAHALAFLDGDLPSSAGARWEVSLPLLEWRSEQVRAHPECPCGARRGGEAEHAMEARAAHDTMAGQGPPRGS